LIVLYHPPRTKPSRQKNKRRFKKGKGMASTTSTAAAVQSSEIAAFASHEVTSFDNIEHLLLTGDTLVSPAAQSSKWILDSGASENMTGDKSWVTDIIALDSTVRISTASGGSLAATSSECVTFANHLKKRVKLSRVLVYPGLSINLVSMSRLASIGASIKFYGMTCKVIKDGLEVLRARLEDKVWVIAGSQWTAQLDVLDHMARALPVVLQADGQRASFQRNQSFKGSRHFATMASATWSPQLELDETALWCTQH
jgi:hypothetical protein